MSSTGLHESAAAIGSAVVDMHRALTSLQEELEATDWYNQRVAATADAELKAILIHNRDEEKEHAAMLLDWIRRHDPVWDHQLRLYLLGAGASPRDLGIGRLRSEKAALA